MAPSFHHIFCANYYSQKMVYGRYELSEKWMGKVGIKPTHFARDLPSHGSICTVIHIVASVLMGLQCLPAKVCYFQYCENIRHERYTKYNHVGHSTFSTGGYYINSQNG